MQHVKGTHFDLDWPCVIPLWLACAIWAAILMRQRGHPTWKGLLVGLTLGPVGVFWVLTMPRTPGERFKWQAEALVCRFCEGPVSPHTVVCPHCGRRWPSGRGGD